MKADRLLSALLLLQAHGRLTARELSERLEVSQRTIQRDMEALSAARIPITALRGALGGWRLEKGWRTQVPGLDDDELRALLMTQPRILGHPNLVAAAERAFGKLMAALPDGLREQATSMRERLYVDTSGWCPTNEDLSMLPAVQDAVARDLKLAFDYVRADGQRAPRVVDPLGLVGKGPSWYLVAHTPKGMRTYRVSRMHAVIPSANSFRRPANFNLAKFWRTSLLQLRESRRRYEATLCLSASATRSLRRWYPTSMVQDTPKKKCGSKGWTILRVEFENQDQARFVALGFGPEVRVLAPASLRQRVLSDASVVVSRSLAFDSERHLRTSKERQR